MGGLVFGTSGKIIPAPNRVGIKKSRWEPVWATGDAVLGRIGAVNWETREYISEETAEFLDEIAPLRRRIFICDAEQLAATSIALVWSHSPTLLLLGNDNRHFLAWPRKGRTDKGASLTPNQETSKLIAGRCSQVEGVYLRSGHNFSPDWAARTTPGNIEGWARHLRGEMMSDYRSLMAKEVMMPEERTERRDEQHRFCQRGGMGRKQFRGSRASIRIECSARSSQTWPID